MKIWSDLKPGVMLNLNCLKKIQYTTRSSIEILCVATQQGSRIEMQMPRHSHSREGGVEDGEEENNLNAPLDGIQKFFQAVSDLEVSFSPGRCLECDSAHDCWCSV